MAMLSLEVASGASARQSARLAALGQAALCVQEVLTPEAVLAEMGAQLSALGFGWQHSRLVEDGATIALEGVSLSPSLIATVQRLLGIRLIGFRLPVDGLRAVRGALVDHQAVLVDGAGVVAEVFPGRAPGRGAPARRAARRPPDSRGAAPDARPGARHAEHLGQ